MGKIGIPTYTPLVVLTKYLTCYNNTERLVVPPTLDFFQKYRHTKTVFRIRFLITESEFKHKNVHFCTSTKSQTFDLQIYSLQESIEIIQSNMNTRQHVSVSSIFGEMNLPWKNYLFDLVEYVFLSIT